MELKMLSDLREVNHLFCQTGSGKKFPRKVMLNWALKDRWNFGR